MKERTIQAVKDKIVALIVKEEKMKGSIIIPETANRDPQGYGRVISVGEEVKKIGKVKKGDIILFHRSGGQDIMLDGKIVKVLSYNELYGVLKEIECPV